MKLRTGLILSAVLAGGVLVLAPTNASAQEPKDNMYTRSATLYLSQAQTQPDPEEKRQRYMEALDVSRQGIEKSVKPPGYRPTIRRSRPSTPATPMRPSRSSNGPT
jgi:hypothetical protein